MRAWALIAALVVALSGVGQGTQEAVPQPPTRQSARERWESMTPAERDVMRERFEALKGMQEGRQRELRQRHGRWQESERRTLGRLPKNARTRLEMLSPEKRREVMRELTEEDLSARGRALFERLPPEWRERLESAAPEDRRRVLEEFRSQHRDRGERGVLDEAQQELGLQPGERDAIEALPQSEREARLIELRARSIRERAQREGLPPWIQKEEWSRLEALEPRTFLEEFHARHRQAGGPARSRDAEGQRTRPGKLREPSLRGQLRALARPDPSWRVELSQMTPEARRTAIEGRVRGRVEGFLEQHPDALTAEQQMELQAAQGRDFFDLLREAIGTEGRRAPPGAGGPGAPRHPPEGRGEGRGERAPGRRGAPDARRPRKPSSPPPQPPQH